MELEILQNQINSEFPPSLTVPADNQVPPNIPDASHSSSNSFENQSSAGVFLSNPDTFDDLPSFVEARVDRRGRYETNPLLKDVLTLYPNFWL